MKEFPAPSSSDYNSKDDSVDQLEGCGGDSAVNANYDDDDYDERKSCHVGYHQPFLRHGSHHAEAPSSSCDKSSQVEQQRRPFFVIRNNPPEPYSLSPHHACRDEVLSTKEGDKARRSESSKKKKKKRFGTKNTERELEQNNENNNGVILNGMKRDGRGGGAWKNYSKNDVIRVPSTGCDDDDDEYYWESGRETEQKSFRKRKKRRRARIKNGSKRLGSRGREENRYSDYQSFNAAPDIGPGATTAFPRGFSDGRILASRQRRREEEKEKAEGSFRRRSRIPLRNVVRVVDEADGLFSLRLVNDKEQETTAFAFQKGLNGRESDLLYLAKRSWEHLLAFATLAGKKAPSKCPFLDRGDGDDECMDKQEKNVELVTSSINLWAGSCDFTIQRKEVGDDSGRASIKATEDDSSSQEEEDNCSISSFVPVADDIRDIIDSTISIETVFHWNVIRNAREQGEIDLATMRNLIYDVQSKVPLFITAKDGVILSHKTHIFSFNQFVALACAVEKYLEDLANAPAELCGQILDVTHCSVKVLVRSNFVPCNVAVAVSPQGLGPPPKPSDFCEGSSWCSKIYPGTSSSLLNALSRGRIDTTRKSDSEGVDSDHDRESDLESDESDDDDDTTDDNDVDNATVVIEVGSLSSDLKYDVYLYGERLAKNGMTTIKSSKDYIFCTRLQIQTKDVPEPDLFPTWDSLDEGSQKTELLAAIKDRKVQSNALETGLDVSVITTFDIPDDLQMKGSDSPWVEFATWWRYNVELRADFCERELRHASRDEEIKSVAAENDIIVRQGDWNARDPEKLKRWKIFCWWYHDILPLQSAENTTERRNSNSQSPMKDERENGREDTFARHLNENERIVGGDSLIASSLTHAENNFINFDFSSAGSPSHLKGLHLSMRTTAKTRNGAAVNGNASDSELDPIDFSRVFPSIQSADYDTSSAVARRSSFQGDSHLEGVYDGPKRTCSVFPKLKRTSENTTLTDVQSHCNSNNHAYGLAVKGISPMADFSRNLNDSRNPSVLFNSDIPWLDDSYNQQCRSQKNINRDYDKQSITRDLVHIESLPASERLNCNPVEHVHKTLEDDNMPLSSKNIRCKDECKVQAMSVGVRGTKNHLVRDDTVNDCDMKIAMNENDELSHEGETNSKKMNDVMCPILRNEKKNLRAGPTERKIDNMDDKAYVKQIGDESGCNGSRINNLEGEPMIIEDSPTEVCDINRSNDTKQGGSKGALALSLISTKNQVVLGSETIKREGNNGQEMLTESEKKTGKGAFCHGTESARKGSAYSNNSLRTFTGPSSRGMRNKYLGSRLTQIDTAVSKVEKMIHFTNEAKNLKGIALFRAKAKLVTITQKLNTLKQKLQQPATTASDIANLDLFEDFDGAQFDTDEVEHDTKSTLPQSVDKPAKDDKAEKKRVSKTKNMKELSRTAKKAYKLKLLRRCFAALKEWQRQERIRAEEKERSKRKHEAACRADALRVLRTYFRAWNTQILLEKQKLDEEEQGKKLLEKAFRGDRLRLLKKTFDGFVQARNLSAKPALVEEVDDETETVDLELERLEKESKLFALEDYRARQHRAFSNELHYRNVVGNPLDHNFSFFRPFGIHKALNVLHDLRYEGSTRLILSRKKCKPDIIKTTKPKRNATQKNVDTFTTVGANYVCEKDVPDNQAGTKKSSIFPATGQEGSGANDVLHNALKTVNEFSLGIVFVNGKRFQSVTNNDKSKADAPPWKAWHYEELASKERWLMSAAEHDFRNAFDREVAVEKKEISCFGHEDGLSRSQEEREKRIQQSRDEREKTYGVNVVDIGWKKRIIWKGPRKRNILHGYKIVNSPFTKDDSLAEQLWIPEADVYLLERSTKRFMAMMGFPLWNLPYSWNTILAFAPNMQGNRIDRNTTGIDFVPPVLSDESANHDRVPCVPTQYAARKMILPAPYKSHGMNSCAFLYSSPYDASPDKRSNDTSGAKHSTHGMEKNQIPCNVRKEYSNHCQDEDDLPEKPFARKHLKGHLIMGTKLFK